MPLIADLMAKPSTELSVPSRYTVLNGVMYLATGLAMIVWPALIQTIFMEPPFVGHEASLFRIIGLLLAIVGWFYIFGGRSGARQFVAATVLDRIILVPLVLVPVAIAGAFPHVAITFAILDPLLALGTWALMRRAAQVPQQQDGVAMRARG